MRTASSSTKSLASTARSAESLMSGAGAAWLGWVATGLALGVFLGWRSSWTNPSLAGARNALLAEGYAALCYGVFGAVLGVVALIEIAVLARFVRRLGRPNFAFRAHTVAAAVTFGGFCAGNYALAHATRWATEIDKRSVAAGVAAALVAQLLASALLAFGSRLGRIPAAVWWGRATLAALVLVPLGTVLGFVPSRPATGVGEPPAPVASTPPVERVVLLGIDGADWKHVQPLLDAGKLPNLARLVEAGSAAPLRTLLPTWSPTIWTTIATGRLPEAHGVLDFTEVPLPGFDLGVQRLRAVERLAQDPGGRAMPMPPFVGLTPLVYGLVEAGVLREEPIRAYHRRVKALWNILSDQERSVGVVRWWATWPAEEVHGGLVSDNSPRQNACHAFERMSRAAAGERLDGLPFDPTITYPPELIAKVAKLDEESLGDAARWWGDDDTAEARRIVETLPFFADLDAEQREALVADPGLPKLVLNISEEDRFAIQSAVTIHAEHDPQLLAVYLQGVDGIGHRIEFHAKRDPGFLTVIARYWERVDELLGELRATVGDGATWMVVSDHGWSYAPDLYGHYHAPDGMFLLSGPAARASERSPGEGPHVIDVTPTILALLGLPSTDEMPGTPITAALRPELAAGLPTERLESYGTHRPKWSAEDAGGTGGTRESQLDTLRELGYVDG